MNSIEKRSLQIQQSLIFTDLMVSSFYNYELHVLGARRLCNYSNRFKISFVVIILLRLPTHRKFAIVFELKSTFPCCAISKK